VARPPHGCRGHRARRRHAAIDVPDEWLRPGESRSQIAERLRELPLINVEIRDFAASYLFADRRFISECRLYRTKGPGQDRVGQRAIREDPGTGLVYSFGSAADAGGGPNHDWPADMLMVGSYAPKFDRVEVVLEDGSTVDASMHSGLWLAWWNVPLSAVGVRGYDADGRVTSIKANLQVALGSGN
jgi:hypothetical protein